MKKIFTFFFFTAAICFTVPQNLSAQVKVADSLALVALYNATDGPHWFRNDKWLTKAPVNNWYGIDVFDSIVDEIILANNNLVGYIPADLGNMNHHIDDFELEYNKLSGPIPKEFFNNDFDDRLLLDHNELSGTIPHEIGNLINVQILSLNNNQLSGNIPPEISNLQNIYTLFLDSNQLSGSLPNEIGNMTSVRFLMLNNNQLSGNIPSEIGNLSNLLELHLENNQFSGNIPTELGHLKSVEYGINLSHNNLSGRIPKSLSKINAEYWNGKDETGLNLSYNQLSGTIPHAFGKPNTYYFNFSHNRLTGQIPYSLGANLFYESIDIDLSNNKLSGSIPPNLSEAFSNSYYHTTLYLDSNNFTFAGMVNLVRKNAKDNQYQILQYSPQNIIPLHQNNNVLSVYTGGAYQLTLDTFKWYNNGTLIATIIGDSTFTPSENGNYFVAVTNAVATELTLYSDTINYVANADFIASNIKSEKKIFASVFPNPVKTYTTLSFSASGNYSINIVDMYGKTLQTIKGVSNKTQNAVNLNLSHYVYGFYNIMITDEKNEKRVLKVFKSN